MSFRMATLSPILDTDNFIIHIKTECFYKDIADDVEKRYNT